MRNLTLIFLFCLFYCFHNAVHAQNQKWELIYGVNRTYRTLDYNTDASAASTVADNRHLEKPAFGYNIGARYMVYSKHNLAIKTGLDLARLNYDVNITRDLRWPTTITVNGIETIIHPNVKQADDIIFNNLYIELPIVLEFRLPTHRFTPFIQAVTAPQYTLETYRSTTYSGSDEIFKSTITGLRKVNLINSLAVGSYYIIGKKMAFSISASLRSQAFRINQNGTIHERLFSYGLNLGLHIDL